MPLATRFRFDKSRASAGDWARDYAGELIKGIDATTRMWIREMIASAFEEERDLDELADDIYGLLDDEDRAEKIARTETIRAANRGQQEAWAQATEEGLLTGNELQEWIITPDDRLCPICEALDGETAEFGDSFTTTDGVELDGPPAHPNCRCTLGLTVPVARARRRSAGGKGSGNFGHAGRPGEVGGSAPGDGTVTWDQPLDSNGRPIPIRVSSVEEAIPLILAKKVVELPDVRSVNTVLTKLAELSLDAQARGEKAPKYDLCQVSVPGTNLFCGSQLRTEEFPNGIPRIEMPVIPGDLKEDFIASLLADNIGHVRGRTPAAELKASQAQLIGAKVAELMTQTKFDPAVSTIFISRDNYVIDGHHRWAAVIGRDAADNKLGDLHMNTIRLDLPISELYHRAKAWSASKGIVGRAAQGERLRSSTLEISTGTVHQTLRPEFVVAPTDCVEHPNTTSADSASPVIIGEMVVGGGKGSGNFDHAGRPGEIGGSSPSQAMRDTLADFEDRVKNPRLSRPPILMGNLPVPERQFSEYLETHGQEWKAAPIPEGIPKGEMGLCYANASRLLLSHDLAYVEGIAYKKGLPAQMGFLHAWNVDNAGNVIDSTWGYDPENKYFGVKYDKAKYMAHMIRTKVFGVFGGLTKHAEKILKKGGL